MHRTQVCKKFRRFSLEQRLVVISLLLAAVITVYNLYGSYSQPKPLVVTPLKKVAKESSLHNIDIGLDRAHVEKTEKLSKFKLLVNPPRTKADSSETKFHSYDDETKSNEESIKHIDALITNVRRHELPPTPASKHVEQELSGRVSQEKHPRLLNKNNARRRKKKTMIDDTEIQDADKARKDKSVQEKQSFKEDTRLLYKKTLKGQRQIETLTKVEEAQLMWDKLNMHNLLFRASDGYVFFYNVSNVVQTDLEPGAITYKMSEKAFSIINDPFSFNDTLYNYNRSTEIQSILPTGLLLPSPVVCKNESAPYILIMIPSIGHHRPMRMAIRETWARPIYQSHDFFGKRINKTLRLVFVIAREEKINLNTINNLKTEQKEFGDILLMDFVDSYLNLSVKVASSLNWAHEHCQGAKYVMKVDEDTFIHLPQLLDVIGMAESKIDTFVLGHRHMSAKPTVARFGRWEVSEAKYPLPYFPRYLYGHSYVVSMSAIPSILDCYRKLPQLHNEDVLFTGILAKLANVTRIHHKEFAVLARRERMCDIVNGKYIAVSPCCIEHHYKLYLDMKNSICDENILGAYPVTRCHSYHSYNANMTRFDKLDRVSHRLVENIIEPYKIPWYWEKY